MVYIVAERQINFGSTKCSRWIVPRFTSELRWWVLYCCKLAIIFMHAVVAFYRKVCVHRKLFVFKKNILALGLCSDWINIVYSWPASIISTICWMKPWALIKRLVSYAFVRLLCDCKMSSTQRKSRKLKAISLLPGIIYMPTIIIFSCYDNKHS